ncbi:hypothetical protein HF086_008067 [Spodoptera exigua]|uniref:Uncharacterized protein n=1 Tax=Spodoptera exigua TaxID=7107 RepID=A0A922MNG9_SPOEX|nr:hypothetical protein HF086_008067 [Spodoptera exigua]
MVSGGRRSRGSRHRNIRLRQTLAARLAEIDDIVSEFDRVSERIDEFRQQIEVLTAKVRTFYVFGEDEADSVRALTNEVSDLVERTKNFTEESRKRYGGSAPADVAQELSSLELSSEALAAAMEEKEREWKRARTARSEYATDVEDVQAWVRSAELTARDRTLAPEPYRERLVATRAEVPNVADRVERLTRNARAIVEGSRDAGERQLVQSTVTALSDQFSAVCSELEARQAAVEDACDAVARFLTLLEKVLLWVETQRAFLARPLPLADLQEAQQKQTEYGNALKSCKQQAKNLADMAKEIEAIERVTSPGDLPSRLEAAENATVDVEKRLAKTNGLLQELAEEWERCEKKLKDVGHWLEATSRTLETPQNAKKPLRDRLALREKLINDISTQKTKISYAVEKLNVHFGPDGVAAQSVGPEGVEAAARSLAASLDALAAQTGAQAAALARALAQVEAYCADVGRLRAQLLQAEQQLRQAAQPNYSPREPERASRHQQDVARRIEELTGAIYALDPYFVMPATDEHAATLSMLVTSATHARNYRRARSPERRQRARLAPAPAAPAARARSPCWAPGGVTYAEIVKGSGSRSSSRGSRAPDDHEPPRASPSPPELADVGSDPVEVLVEPCVLSERVDEPVSRSDTRVTESISVSEPYGGDVIVYYDDFTSRSEPEPVTEYYAEPPVEYREMPIDVPATIYQESPEPLSKLPEQPMMEIQLIESERDASPMPKNRSHELSYAEILALGLRKQPRTHSVTSLPKPQVAQVELVKEIVVECVERSPPIQQYESKVEKIEPPRFKPDRPERPEKTNRLERSDRPERPAPRSRSRDMPRQRRGPEKRPSKAHDIQAMKKKKTMKKVIEVEDFDEPEQPIEVQLTPISNTLIKSTTSESTVETVYKEVTKKLQHSATVVETVTEIVAEDSQPETSAEEVEHKKPKKKQKPKKPKSPEDEIQKALKEIEELERSKKKKAREPRDKSKDSITDVLTVDAPKEPITIDSKKMNSKEMETQIKSKKKKGHKESPDITTDVTTEFITVESSAPVEVTTKEIKPKKKKSQKQASLDKSELNSIDSVTERPSECIQKPIETKSDSDSVSIVEIVSQPEITECNQTRTRLVDDLVKEQDFKNGDELHKESSMEVISTVTSSVTHHISTSETVTITSTENIVSESSPSEIILSDYATSQPAFEIDLQEQVTDNIALPTDSIISETETTKTPVKHNVEQASVVKECELFSVQNQALNQEDQANKKPSKNKKKSQKCRQKPEEDITSEFICKESEKVEPEKKPVTIIESIQEKLEEVVAGEDLPSKQLEKNVPQSVQTAAEKLVILEEIETVLSENQTSQLEHQQQTTLLQTLQQGQTVELETVQIEQEEQIQQSDKKIKVDELTSKNKKKKKQKKLEKNSEPVLFEDKKSVVLIEENVKSLSLEPPAREIPNIVEQVEEQKPQKKKKSKKGKPTEVKDDTVETTVVERKEIVLPTTKLEASPKTIEELQSQEDSKRKKKSKSKPKPVENEQKFEFKETVEIEVPSPETSLEETKVEEPAFEEVKSHKKRKSKKQKIEDDDIEKALKEIERTEGSKKKPKEKTPKQKGKPDQSIPLTTEPEEVKQEIQESKVFEQESLADISLEKVEHDTSPEENTENTQPIEHIDWNAMLEEEEESLTEIPFESVKQEPESPISETAYIANQVTILQETTDLLESERTVSKIEPTTEQTVLPGKSSENVKDQTVFEEVQQQFIEPSLASEQNNNDKFFSTEVVKEGSYNIVEEVTHYEPITQDVETRTIYLITHEEKKLPPIRTVKVFRSKSNSLEEPQPAGDDVVLSEKTINKITDDKSSINVSDNVLDSKVVTGKLSSEINVVEIDVTDIDSIPEAVKGNVIENVTSESSVLTRELITNVVSEKTTKETITVDDAVNINKIEVTTQKLLTPTDQISDKTGETPEKFTNEFENETVPDKSGNQLSEEDFSEIIEQAIFGSVQDRNRTITENKSKDKSTNIPYQELLNEVKTYSENLDTYQLDYDYSQLITSQRESQVSQGEESIVVQQERPIKPVTELEADELSPDTEVRPAVVTEKNKDTDVNYSEDAIEKSTDKLKENVLKNTFATVVSTNTEIQHVVDFIKSESSVLIPLDQVDATALKTDTNVNIEDVVNPEPKLVSSVDEEEPRISYYEIKDAEVILASLVSEEKSETTTDAHEKTVSSSRVSETVKKSENTSMVQETLEKVQYESLTNEDAKKDRVSPVKEEAPRVNYHEIKDAEIILASQSIPKEESNSPNVVNTLKTVNVEDEMLKTLCKTTTTLKAVTNQTADLISAEKVLLEPEVPEIKVITDGDDKLLTGLRPLSYEEVPRHSYHEIMDAERNLATITRQPHDFEQVKPDSSVIEAPKDQPATAVEVPKVNYQEIADAEKHLATVAVTSKAPEEKFDSEVESSTLASTSSICEPIFEAPRVSYHEISDAENLLATILSRDASKESSPIDTSENVLVTSQVEETTFAAESTERVDVVITSGRTESQQNMVNHVPHNDVSIHDDEISPIIENVPQLVPEPEPIRQAIYEVPRFSYHEINDAESLFAFSRISIEEVEVPVEISDTTTTERDTIITETVPDNFLVPATSVSEEVKQITSPEEVKTVFEPLRHSYHEIQDAERTLASMKVDQVPQTSEEKPTSIRDLTKAPSEHVEETLLQVGSQRPKTDKEHTIDFLTNESILSEPVQNIVTDVEKPSALQKAHLAKIALSFEVDDLSNTPVSVVYGSEGTATPIQELQSPVFKTEEMVPESPDIPKTTDNVDMPKVEELKQNLYEPSVEDDTFEIIDHSEVTNIVTNVKDSEPEDIKLPKPAESSNIVNISTSEVQSLSETTSNQQDSTPEQPRSITPKTSDDHIAVKNLIEEALQEHESTTVTRTKPAYETFVIDDLNESLVPVVFGDIKDIEHSIKYRKEELLLQTEPLEPVQPTKSVEKIITIANEEELKESASSIEDIEIVETEGFTIPHPSEYVELGPSTVVELDAKPDTISADTQSEVFDSVINLPETQIVKKTDLDTHIPSTDFKTEHIVSKDIREIQLTQTETVSRVEKSPIHSLHDLLPEIDSIPEFKPSYSNTVLFSKLSADAPEFTPSYMYQTVTTVSESRSDVVGDAHAPITVEEESIHIVTEEKPSMPQISYSSVLQTKKEKIEVEPQTPPSPVEKVVVPDVPDEVNEERVETKSKKNKKRKKKDRDEKKESKSAETVPIVPLSAPTQAAVPAVLPEPVNVWVKAAEEGKSYADVLAEGLAHEQREFIQIVSEKPKERELSQPRIEKAQHDVAKMVKPTQDIKDIVEIKDVVSENEHSIGSWAKIVAKRSSPERIQKEDEPHVTSTHVPTKAPMIFVDESESDHQRPEVEVDAEGFITVDRSRRSRSKSREARSRSGVSQNRETREKSENRFEALTTTLRPDDVESTQSPSEDEKPAKKPSRKSRSSKSRDKEMKPKAPVVAPSTSDEDKQPPKKDKKKRSSKSKDKVVPVPVEEKLKPDIVEISEPLKEEEKDDELPSTTSVQSEPKKKNKKKKKEKKPVEMSETTEASSPLEVTSSEQEIFLEATSTTKTLQRKLDTPVSTPESIQTPIKDRVFSEAQFWKMDPSTLDVSEIISVEIQHTPKETYKIEIKENVPTEELITKSEETQKPKDFEPVCSPAKYLSEEITSVETQIHELAEDQSLESKMADLQREIEEMLLPENDSSLTSDDSPKELTDTQTSMEYQYDELLDNMTPSLASPELDVEPKSIEESTLETTFEDNNTKHDEDLDDKHISMSMIDSVLDDTEPLSITETHSLEHSEGLLVTQEEDTPRDSTKLDTSSSSVTTITTSEKVKIIPKDVLETMIKDTMAKQEITSSVVKTTTTISGLDVKQDEPTTASKSTKPTQEEISTTPPVLQNTGVEGKKPQVITFIETEKNIQLPEATEKKETIDDSVTRFIEMEKSQTDILSSDVKNPELKNIELLSTSTKENISEQENISADFVSNVPLSNIDTNTNTITNLKADSFWTDKHKIDDAELLFIERQSVERTIVSVDTDETHVDEGISVEDNIIIDNTFWPEKHLYHDAECQYFLSLARKAKTPTNDTTETKVTDQNDKDRDQGGSSGHSSEGEEPKDPSGSPYDPDYISMDLPGGICSWKDKSSYLSVETPVVDDADVLNEPVSREDILTTLPIAPAPSSSTQEPEETPQRTTKDELSNDIETLLEEIRDVQTRLADLPDESLVTMAEGLKEGISILLKCEEAAEILETKIMEYRQEQEVQTLLKDLVIMRAKISKLLKQANDGLEITEEAKVQVAIQAKEIEENKEKIAKLDKWLETINNGLKETVQQSEVLTEEDIIRYIEIYDRYLMEYEEYETIMKSITVISQDETSQSLKVKLVAMQKALMETKNLVNIEIERLRQVLLQMKSAPEVIDDDISQTDRTIDSTSMPEEVVSPRESQIIKEKEDLEKVPSVKQPSAEESVKVTVQESKPSPGKPEPVQVQVVKETVAIETQTGKSLMSEPPSVSDKSVICQPEAIVTHDVSITCAPPIEMAVQTSEPHSEPKEILENIQVRQTISDGHETIEIASRPVVREQKLDEKSLLVDANYKDDNFRKDSQLNITHSLPQSFETVMVEPDETTTEVVVDADGTKRIIVKKVRKTLVTRQQILQSQQHESHILSSDLPLDQAYSQIVIRDEKAGTSTTLEDGGVQHMEYQSYGGQVITSLPGGEVTIQEFTSKPDMKITMEKDMNPEQILLLAEGHELPQVQTSTSSVTAVVQQVTKRIVKTRRRIIRRVVIIDGKEHVTEEIIEEPDNVDVVEEQIPRVSINVRERGDVPPSGGEDDDDRRDDHPALPPRKDDDSSKADRPKYDKPDDKPSEARPQDGTPKDEKPDDSQDQQVDAPVELTQAQQLEKMMQDFIQKEGTTHRTITQSTTRVQTSQERESTPVKTVTVSESFEILPGHVHGQEPIETTYIVQEPHDEDGQTTLITEGMNHSTFESSSTNVATVVQKVTRKITRTRRRIIKHIQIIDGKEHVTEEVIEEPDDVEVIEEEPQISHSIQTEGVKTKRIRIIKQVQIIDGKEHVTEQIVEEPDDEYVPDSTITTEIDVKLSKPEALEVIQEDVKSEFPTITKSTTVTVMPTQKDTTMIDVTKGLIGSEIEHFTETKPETKQMTVTKETTPSSLKKTGDETDSTVKIVKETIQFNEPEITTTKSTKETDGVTTTKVTRHVTSELSTVTSTDTQRDTSLIDVTKSLITSEIEHASGPQEASKKPKELITSEPIKDVPVKSEPADDVPIKSELVKDVSVKSEPGDEVPVKSEPVKEELGKTEIAKEKIVTSVPIKEEPVKFDSPDVTVITKTVTVTSPVDETKTTFIVTTKKSISDVAQQENIPTVGTSEPVYLQEPKEEENLPAKEKVTKDKIQEPEKVMQVIQKTVQSTEPEITITKKTSSITQVTGIINDAPKVTETITKTIRTEIPETNGIKDTTLVDITKSLLESEMDHSVVSKIPASPVKNVTETKETKQSPAIETKELKKSKPVEPVDEILSEPQEIKPKVTVEVKLTEQRLPATDDSTDKAFTKQPQMVADKTIKTQKDSSLHDITKSFIGTEIDHSAIHKTSTKPMKNEEIDQLSKPSTETPKNDEIIPETQKIMKSPETDKVMDNKTVTTTTQKTITTAGSVQQTKSTVETFVTKSPEIVTIVKETIEIEPETIGTTQDIFLPEPEMAQALEVTDVTPASTTDVPKDTGLVDLTKSFIGSEMDHTIVSKIPASPIKREESLEMAIEAIEEPKTPETLVPAKETAISETETATRIPEQIDEQIITKLKTPDVSVEDQKIVETLKTPVKETISEKKPKDGSVQFITQEITEQQGVTQYNVSEFTQELLEKESVHTGAIHPIKQLEKPKEVSSDVPKDPSGVPVTQISTSTVIEPKNPVQSGDKPSSVLISIKEQPLREKEEIVSIITKETVTSEEPEPKAPEVVEQPSIPVLEDGKPISPERGFPEVEIDNKPKIGVVKLIKEFINQESSDKYERIADTNKTDVEKTVSQVTTEKAPTQSSIEVEPLKIGTVISVADVTEVPAAPEMSYIRQFEPHVQGSSDSVNKLLMTFGQPEKQDVPSQTTELSDSTRPRPDRPGTKYDVSMLLHSERQDTDIRGFKPEPKVTQLDKPEQTVDISLSLTKSREAEKVKPVVQYELKVEDLETEPIVVKKDIEVILPSEVKITKEKVIVPIADEVREEPKAEITPPESVKESKKSRRKKKHKTDSITSESTEIETDKSIAGTDSSSLSHYVELPVSPPRESPTPTEDVLEPVAAEPKEPTPVVKSATPETEPQVPEKIKTPDAPVPEEPQIPEIEDSYVESESLTISEEKGYEAEDLSLGPVPTPNIKKKHKKRKPHRESEETAYPVITTTETDETTVTTPVEMREPSKKGRDKRRKKKTSVEPVKSPSEPDVEPEPVIEPEPVVKPESPKLGTEVEASSPKEESYHTISETSDITTVKIVEECVQSSPETAEREVGTILKFPVPVVEEIATTEYSIQTSPEEPEPIEEVPRPETSDIEMQTTPTSMSEVITQTTPVKDKEAHTQTVEEVVTVVEKIMSDTEIQTSRSETPEQVIQLEATTQVIPHDISTPEEKFSQTSPVVEEPIVVEEKPVTPETITESREMQTSPLPVVQKDEKSTEVIVETTETDIQTVQKEITEQGTSTTPIQEKELTEMGMQTPEVPLVSTFTQSDTPEPEPEKEVELSPAEVPEVPLLPSLEIKKEIITVDSTQQTTPREEVEPPRLEVKEVETIDTSQQTTPREPEPVIQELPDLPEKQASPAEPAPVVEPFTEPAVEPTKKITTVDSTQQTSPRSPPVELAPTPIPALDLERRDVITIDSTQQTSPRNYSEDSISTSTDEPYEIHLKAQISIPQATTEFIESERSFEEPPQSILGDKCKQKKRRPKKKTESPLVQSPESLSDPINTELSLSVTPTSEDMSLKDASSIDEGISQLASPMMPKQTQHKLTYSDVVQRSKSKSPSPSKTIISHKSEKARLLDALEKRTQSVTEPQKTIPDDSMTVALLEPSVEKSYNLVVNKELDEVKNSIESNDPTRTERSVIIVIETISIWLEEIQYKIQRQTVSGVKSTEETERLNTLKKHVHDLKHIIEVTEVSEEIITLIETLTRQVDAVNTLNSQSSIKVKEVEKEWIKFLEDTDKLSYSVEAVKNTLDDVILSELPTQQKLEKLDKIETNNLDNFETIRKMFKRCRSLVEANPKRECPSKLYNAEDDTKQVENTINTERDRLLQLASLAEEYEQTLQDFGQITDVAEALLDGKIIVSDLDHLHEEIQKHRKFFVNLSHCRAILESLEDNLDSETRAKFSSLHNALHDRATIIIDRAASRAQQMTLAASRWSLLQHGMKEEQQWLIVAQQRVPDLSNVTSRDHEQYINLYQSLSLDVSHHYAKMLRLLSITESLQNLIVCSGLESECSVALDTLLKLQEDVDSRLTRLTAFKENWMTYDLLIDRIEGWMKVANRELEFITPENITTTGNLRRFWELKAQHEVHNNLKNESGVQFEKALEILPVSDEMVQRQFFSKIEDKWSELASKIDNIHSSAIQNISDRDVSSGEKLNILEEELRELRAALESLKGVIKSEDELNLYIERLQVMTGRIDRIQNELGRLSLLPTAESERLGVLLTQSGILDDQISEELERSMLLKEKIVQVQAGIIRCQKSQRRARLTLEECEAAERLGSDVVERASENCDKLIDELASQWRDILALRQSLHTLPTSLRVVVSPTGVERDISALQETHAELEAACSDLSSRLRAKLHLWRRFERQLELVQGAVREADYMVELLTVQGQVDYDRLLKATEKLETLSESLSRRSGELVGELTAAAAPLQASTEPSVAASLRRELDDAAAAYEHTCTNLNQLCDKYHKAVELWKRYRDAAAAVRAFADFQESRIHALRPDDAPNTAQNDTVFSIRLGEDRMDCLRI